MTATTIDLEDYLRLRRQLPPPDRRRALRQSARLSQDQVGDYVGVSGSAVALWETGQRFPRPEHLAAYVRLLTDLARHPTP